MARIEKKDLFGEPRELTKKEKEKLQEQFPEMPKKKKTRFNEKKRCNMCSGFLSPITWCIPPYISLPIDNNKIKIVQNYDDENGKTIKETLKEIEINFCPYCGCQLRKKVDWSLCD